MADFPDPDWAALAPELREREAFLDDLARQVRMRLRAGRSEAEVFGWLQELGLSADAAAYFLAACPGAEDPSASTVGQSPEARARRRERQERREKSRHLAETEPDAAFVFADDSYAQVVARESRRGDWRRVVTVVLAVLVSLPLGLALLSLLLTR